MYYFCKMSELEQFFHYHLEQVQKHMLNPSHAVSPANTEQARPQLSQQPAYDFSLCQRMKKLTTHDIYRFTHEEQSLVLKIFAPKSLANYQHEVNCLQRACHPSVLKILYHRPSVDSQSVDFLQRNHLIVLQEATRGDLNEYLPRYGKMSQKMARTYFKSLLQSLKALSELKPPLIHPNLQPSNILLTGQGQLRICGWSQVSSKGEQQRLNENIFCCGQILICLLTSSMPFYKKNSPTDTFFKFLSQEHIGKFWQEMQKKVVKMDKKFTFSPQVKDLLQSILLKRAKGFQELLNHQWTMGDVYTPNELVKILEEIEKVKNQKIEQKRKQQALIEQKKKKDLHNHQITCGLNRSSLQENSQFIKDYEENMIHEEQIPISQTFNCLKIQTTPSFMIASLKDFLRHQNGKCSIMLCEQFILSNHKVAKVNNYVLIDLQFAIADLQEEEDQLIMPEQNQQTVSIRLKVSFIRQGKDIFADAQIIDSNFNRYYTNLALHFIEERIQKRREYIK